MTAWKLNSERQLFPINRDEIAVNGVDRGGHIYV